MEHRRMQVARNKNTDLTPAEEGFDIEPIKGVSSQVVPDSYEDAMALLQAAGITEVEEVKSLWRVVDKEDLVNRAFVIFDFNFNRGDFGPDGFVSVRGFTTEPFERFVFNDGSSGILQTLREMQRQTGKSGGFSVPNGLRKSEYWYDETDGRSITSADEAGKAREAGHSVIPAATYYLV
jgi:hypothetical protein